jgi:hypothetical protein
MMFALLGSLTLALFIGVMVLQWSAVEAYLGIGVGVAMIMVLPASSYFITSVLTMIYQKISTGDVKPFVVLMNTLLVFASTLVVSLLLWFESVPVFKYIFGAYLPRNPTTGAQLVEGTPEYQDAMATEAHYKISFFSGIVKAVLPVYFDTPMKDGMVYAYWSFWATLLPWYVVLFLN